MSESGHAESAARLPVLYSFRRCPYAIRARLALRYAGIRCELREVALSDKPAAMLEASPKATVPVLVVDPGEPSEEVIDESLDIMLWALAQHDPDGWLQADRQLISNLIDANDDQFKHWLDRYKYPEWFEGATRAEALERCGSFLAALDERLQQGRYLCGDGPSLADMAMYSFIRQFAFVDIDAFRAGPYSAVVQWLDAFLASGLFVDVMEKYPVWQPGDEITVF